MHRPFIPMLDEKDNLRQGFFEDDQFASLLKHLPEENAAVARFARVTGWRKAERVFKDAIQRWGFEP